MMEMQMVITFITFNGVSHTLFCALSPFHTVTLFLQGRLGAPNLHPVLYHASCVYLWLLLGGTLLFLARFLFEWR